jgi:Ca-activated chloride channel homolog
MLTNIIIKNKIQVFSLFTFLLVIISSMANAQTDKKYIRHGNKEYEKNNYSESEVAYRKAIDKNKQSPDAVFNTGNALYKQKKYEDAGKQFIDNNSMNENKLKKSASLYNLGNSLFMAKKLKESIEAYKGSLKLNSKNIEAKYNLAYAQDMLKQQQEQEQQQQDKNNQDKNKDENKDDQNKQEQEQQKDQNNKQDQQQQQSISKEDAQRILNALANDEKKVQEKVKLAKAARNKVNTVKNW